MKHSIKYISYAFLSILWASIGINSISAQEKDDFFTIKNSNAIRDSLNLIKFVNPNEAERFAFEILEKYPDKKPNRVQASTYAALGQIYHIKGLTGPTLEYFYRPSVCLSKRWVRSLLASDQYRQRLLRRRIF